MSLTSNPRFSKKLNPFLMCGCGAPVIPLAPPCLFQIDPNQQRSQLLRGDLLPYFSRLRKRHRIGTFLQPFGPHRESIPMSSRSRDLHPEPLTEPCLNLSIYTALVVQP